MKKNSAFILVLTIVSSTALLLGLMTNSKRVRASASNTSAACSFSVSPSSQSLSASGGPGTVNVTASTGCTWTSISSQPWITITSGLTGTGSATVGYTVAPNTGVSNRIGAILVAGQLVPISQSGSGLSCSPTSLTIPQTVNGSLSAGDCRSVIDTSTYADLFSFTVPAGQRVAIALNSGQFDAFLTLIAPDGSVLAFNDDSGGTDSRIPPGSDYFVLPIAGTYLIDASSYNSDQTGAYSLSLTAPTGQNCTYTVSPTSQSFTASGGAGSANVTTSAGCGWQTGSDVSWISPSGATTGNGSGTLNYSVAANTSLGYRVGRVLIAGQVVTVAQAGTGGSCPITPLVLPQSVNGTWAPGECPSGSGSLTDLYSLSGQAGQQVVLSLTTTQSFTSLYIYTPTRLILFVEGNGNLRYPSGTAAFVLPVTGAYIVEAGAGGAGSYTLAIASESAQVCGPVTGLNVNRLCNAGAELGPGGTTETEIVSIPGWATTSNFTVTRYGVSVLPTLADSARIGGGSNFFAGGPNTPGSTATQTVDVSDEATGIDAGQRTAQLEAYLGGYAGDNDTATVRAEYLNSGGTPIGTQLLIGPTNGAFHLVSNSAAIPTGTRAIRVTLLATRVDGSYADAFFDNVSLSLIQSGGTVCPTIANLSPISGLVGSSVLITGTNFSGVTAVKFANSVNAQFTVNSATQITATVPVGAVTGPITLTKPGCSDVASSAFTVTTSGGCSSPSFAAAVNYTPGTQPVGVVPRDFNDDGKIDLAVSNYGTDNVSIFPGTGNGAFGSPVNVAAGDGPTAIASTDFNGDGKFDLAVVNFSSNDVSILIGTGSGGFSSPTNYQVGTKPRNISLADFNGDGKSDIAVANWDSNSVSVLINNGTGGFSATSPLSAGTQTLGVATGDFNSDGKRDIAASNGATNNVSIFLGNGNGTFSSAVNYSTGSWPFSVAAADLNGDGKLDLVTANYNSANVSVLVGNGTGGFAAPVNYPTGNQPIQIAVNDLNGDGKLDLATAVFATGTVSVMLGTGSGTFGTATNLAAGTNPNFVLPIDLNADLKPDLAVTSYPNALSVLLNTCTTSTCPSISGINPGSALVGSSVTITGTNLTGVTAVRFANNVSAQFTVNSDAQITATVPAGAVTGPITVVKTGCNDVQSTTFTVSIAQCISVSISTALSGPAGGSLTVPITVSDTTGRAAIAYDFTLTYDPAVLRLQATPYDRTGTLSASMTVTPNTSVAGQLILSAFGANALAGAGTLLNLKFDVIGAGSSCSNLTLTSFRFNEGTPCATTTNGRACAVGGSITGTVNYCITPKPVPGVVVSAAGTPSATSTTASAGVYQLIGLGAGAYTVTPAKTGDANGIASFDAALIAQHAAMLITLSSCQQTAADSSGDGGISSFDAALVAQFAVGISNASSKVGTWKFVPPSRAYASLTGDQSNQNYDAVLVGDVSGNWAASAALAEALPPQDPLLAQQNVQVALPDLVAGAGTSLILPITVSDLTGRGVLAYDFDLVFNASLLEAQSQAVDATDTLSSSFTVTPNATPGRLRVSGFGTGPLTGSGVLLKLRFNVIGAVGNNTALTWQSFQFNEGSPAVTSVPGRVTVINLYTLSLTPSSQTVPIGGSASLTLVSSVAQPIAVQYPVFSSNPGVASVPSQVTIPANATMTTFAVTANAVGGPVTITAGYSPAPGAPLATATVTVVRLVTCVSAASFAGPNLASESIVAAFGNGLATSTAIGGTIPLPTQLAGTIVSVRDSMGVSRLAPLFFVSDQQINFQIPEGTARGTATVTATSGNGTVSSGAISIVKVAPGLFTANSDGSGVPAAYIIRVKPNGQQVREEVLVLNQQTNRFIPKEIDLTISGDRVFLILFGTGIRFYESISDVEVRFGNEDQRVDAALPQGFYVGLDQVNVEMIRSKIPAGPITATLRVDGVVARSVDLLVK